MPIMTFLVTDADTAIALGSGTVEVLATPRLLAWFEAATVAASAAELTPGQTSVGTSVALKHRRATAVGRQVDIELIRMDRDGARLEFELAAYEQPTDDPPASAGGSADDTGADTAPRSPLATAVIGRAIVDHAAFVANLNRT